MSEIFISYSREDVDKAKLFAEAFEHYGFSVWWDREIPAGSTWDGVIGKALKEAKCIVVLWSSTSVESNWVKEEAEKGARRNILVPILIEDVEIPLGFGRIESATLVDWRGDTSDREFTQLLGSIASKIDRTPTLVMNAVAKPKSNRPSVGDGVTLRTGAGERLDQPVHPSTAESRKSGRRNTILLSFLISVTVIVAVGGYVIFHNSNGRPGQSSQAVETVATDANPKQDPSTSVQVLHRVDKVDTLTLQEELDQLRGFLKEAPRNSRPSEEAEGRIKGLERILLLENHWADPSVTNSDLLREYKTLLAGHGDRLSLRRKEGVAARITVLENLDLLDNWWGDSAVTDSDLLKEYKALLAGLGDLLSFRRKEDVASRIKILESLDLLEKRSADATVMDSDLLREYKALLAGLGDHLSSRRKESVAGKIKALEAAVESYNAVKQKADRKGLTITEELEGWREFLKRENVRRSSAADEYAKQRVAEIEKISSKSATIPADTSLQICKSVQDLVCRESREMATGSLVYYLARVNVPGNRETLRIEWRAEGGAVVHTDSAIVNRGPGYRIWGQHLFAKAGSYELHLYNGEKYLIGRKLFRVR